jgi:hypothetical protein
VNSLAANGLIREYTQRDKTAHEEANPKGAVGHGALSATNLPENVTPIKPFLNEQPRPQVPRYGSTDETPANADDKAVLLDPREIDFMEHVAQVAGVTPRRLKRFVNTYRVIKATLTRPQAGIAVDILDNNDGAPLYKAILVQLALATGHADSFAGYSTDLARTADEGGNLDTLIDYLQQGETGTSPWWPGFLSALQALGTDHNNARMVAAMSELAEFIARFSFCNPDLVCQRASESSLSPDVSHGTG